MTDPPAGALRRTCLHAEHLRLGARMVPFAGWEMPVQYSGIIEEHNAVRTDAGMFDVSHMGRFEVTGPQAAALLRRVCTYDMTHLHPGQGHYAAARGCGARSLPAGRLAGLPPAGGGAPRHRKERPRSAEAPRLRLQGSARG